MIVGINKTKANIIGLEKTRLRLLTVNFLQEMIGPTPVKNKSIKPGMTTVLLKNSSGTAIFWPVTASEIIGQSVPHKTINVRAINNQLFKTKTLSLDKKDSSQFRLLNFFQRKKIKPVIINKDNKIKLKKYTPMSPSAKAWTEVITPLRVINVPRIVNSKARTIRIIFQTLSIFRFSWIITECK